MRRWLAVLAIAFGCFAHEVSAQVIRGRLLDAQSGLPVPVGRLVVLDSAFVPLASTLSDARGQFSVRLEGTWPVVMIYASALSYRSYVDGPFEVKEADTLHIDFRIEPHPIEVDSLAVTVEGRQRRLEFSGFYSRREIEPGGVFLELEDLEEKRAVQASDYFRGISGVYVVPAPYGRWKVLLRNRCRPNLYVDGLRLRSQDSGGGGIDDLVLPNEVEGVEIYRGAAQVPLQYGGTGSRCGVILIWTR